MTGAAHQQPAARLADVARGLRQAGPSSTSGELKPLGFKVTAQVVSYEGGVPVNITMYLKW